MSPSTGTWSASLLPPIKLYLEDPVHLSAGAGKDGAKSGVKSNDAETMLFLPNGDPSIATARRLSRMGGVHKSSCPVILPSPAGLDHANARNRVNPISDGPSSCETDGLHRKSGLPELRNMMRRTSGKSDVRRQVR